MRTDRNDKDQAFGWKGHPLVNFNRSLHNKNTPDQDSGAEDSDSPLVLTNNELSKERRNFIMNKIFSGFSDT